MKYLFMISIVFVSVQFLPAQEAVKAFASGETSFLLFAKQPYDSGKQYTIIRFTKSGRGSVTMPALDKVATIIQCEWSTEQDADKVLAPYNIKSTAKPGHTLQLEGQDFSMTTTSAIAYLVLLDHKPQLLCCGDDCEARLAHFFR